MPDACGNPLANLKNRITLDDVERHIADGGMVCMHMPAHSEQNLHVHLQVNPDGRALLVAEAHGADDSRLAMVQWLVGAFNGMRQSVQAPVYVALLSIPS